SSRDAAIALTPPFEKRVITIDADRAQFAAKGIATAGVEIATVIAGRPRLQQKAILRAGDAESTATVSAYGDRGADTIVRVTWHGKDGRTSAKTDVLDARYLFL